MKLYVNYWKLMVPTLFTLLLMGCEEARKPIAHPDGIAYYKEKRGANELELDSPAFRITGRPSINEMTETQIYLKLLNSHKFYISYTLRGKDYEYASDTGSLLKTPHLNMTVKYTRDLTAEDLVGLYYFKFLKPGTP